MWYRVLLGYYLHVCVNNPYLSLFVNINTFFISRHCQLCWRVLWVSQHFVSTLLSITRCILPLSILLAITRRIVTLSILLAIARCVSKLSTLLVITRCMPTLSHLQAITRDVPLPGVTFTDHCCFNFRSQYDGLIHPRLDIANS